MNTSTIIEDSISQLNSILSTAHEQFISNPNDFFSQDRISSLGKYISILVNLCNLLNLSDYNELKQHLENSSFSDLRIRWNNFLSEVDNQSILSSSYPSTLPSDIQLLNINNDELIDLKKHVQLLTTLNQCHIVIVSFTSSIDSARQWKNEVQCPFDIYCDSDRCLYQHFGFPNKAYARVWNVQTLDYYVEQKLSGKQLPTKLDKNDDPNQMGGNAIIDRNGRVIWVYKSKTPTDRPSVKQLQFILEHSIHDDSHLNFDTT
ncbi:unnamed protein product [Rotaria sordida]|uniref:Thioredoxin-like fold domain-containing protein n=1 Tax=Rotaria sordida TaxID=392033 RepID=A0A818LUQ7_9BILA|nr:unnamed protein product [Rotaria sordida]CAF1065269.1 unnamed protein product [Rotaria sordida]CAF1233027.1 unnamed protein product [Rotaria sordida]CAF1239601.1 unnamed protein product [Rotaria sordida]CAF3583578.1 unnamed protein product [Rotaria sordida]